MKLNKNHSSFFWATFSILLFYSMRFIDNHIDLSKYVGPTTEAAQAAKYFLYMIAGTLALNLSNPFIKKLHNKRKRLQKVILQSLNYPFDYSWISIVLFALSAENVNSVVRTPIFTFFVITTASFLQIPVRKFVKYDVCKGVKEKVILNTVVRVISLFIVVFIVLMIFIQRT